MRYARGLAVVVAGVMAVSWSGAEEPAAAPVDPALARTRKQVQMLDGIYKNAIVIVTENYVHDDDDMPAGIAFKKLFEAAKKNNWHEVRLIDATGEPYNEENVAKDEFEKRGIAKLKAGEAYYDETITRDGKPYLRAVTAVPVVMEKCVMCHDQYSDAKKGAAIGALGYTVPIE